MRLKMPWTRKKEEESARLALERQRISASQEVFDKQLSDIQTKEAKLPQSVLSIPITPMSPGVAAQIQRDREQQLSKEFAISNTAKWNESLRHVPSAEQEAESF